MSGEVPPRVNPVDLHLGSSHSEDKYANVGRCASTGKEVTICYNTFGNPSDPCLLLVQGLGTSLLGYSLEFVQPFVAAGYFVIRYDNRDVGRSTMFSEFSAPALIRYGLPAWASVGERQPYRLEDMMEDAIGLLTALQIKQAHVFGMSMGGMIVQLMATHHPERVLSLNIMMSHLGGRDAVEPGIFTHIRFLKKPKSDSVEDRIDHLLGYINFLSQGQYQGNHEELRQYLRRGFERDGHNNELGQPRQIAALMRAESRRAALARVRVPTVVIHGALDPLIPVVNAYRLGETIDNAKVVIFPKLGHDFPPVLYSEFADEILLNMRQVSADSVKA